MYDGMINVCKEKGFTSHDVVAKLRGILHQKRIGHTGTLDPDATGVLPVCLGKGTKLCDMITDRDKTYHAVILRIFPVRFFLRKKFVSVKMTSGMQQQPLLVITCRCRQCILRLRWMAKSFMNWPEQVRKLSEKPAM